MHAFLIPHPATPCPQLSRLEVHVVVRDEGSLTLAYRLTGDIAGLKIPPTTEPGRRHGLWRHTCCEAFVMANGGPSYREFNFSPSRDWAAYDFASYRDGAVPAPITTPTIACHVIGDTLALEAYLPADALPAGLNPRLALSAVIEDRQGRLSYWALCHPAERPDFHHTDGFALSIECA